MAEWAEYADGTGVSEEVFRTLARFAPRGTLDVLASDQHGSYLRMIGSFLEHIGEPREATDEDVREVCRRFADKVRGKGVPSAALFNHLAYMSEGFRDLLGEDILLIGRLEDTRTEEVADGQGQLARFAVEPEEAAEYVDGFKTLVKLNPDHPDSWNRNRDWLAGVWEKARDLGKPLFNETLIFTRPGETKPEMARRLPEDVVKMAEDFGPLGHFYKTQVPMLWAQDEEGLVERISSPDELRSAAVTMFSVVDRPMLLLSAGVDFAQYAAQYALVSDVVAGPMCGRAYFKEAFTAPQTEDMDSLADAFEQIALPRMRQIRDLAGYVSMPWWAKFVNISDDAEELIDTSAQPTMGVQVDGDY